MWKEITNLRNIRRLAAASVAVSCLLLAPAPAAAQDRLCDPAYQDCRKVLIDHIRAEKVGLEVAFWFMEDSWIATEVINRWKAGVPVRVLMDTRANGPNPLNADRLKELADAGIPMRERYKTGSANGILHWKMMLFAGQNIVEFSAANFSANAWVYTGDPYTNYVDEAIYFTGKPSVVNSFKTKFDDLWTNTEYYRDYANITTPPVRMYETYEKDPELNFPPFESYATRAVGEYYKETEKMDVIIYRITDRRHTDALIDLRAQGLPIRLITEPKQYRDPNRLWHSWNVDRLYMAGVQIKHRKRDGLNHQKSVLLYSQGMTIFGSSNWTSPSAHSQEEHNYFTKDPWLFQWFVDQFERKWNNSNPAGVEENAPFAPLPPGQPRLPSPAYQATGVSTTAPLMWDGSPWAHTYDVYLGTSSGSMSLVGKDLPLGPSQWDGHLRSFTPERPFLPGTTYYWRVVGRTMANMTAESPIWTFKTEGTAPAAPVLVRQPYLQQVTAAGARIVWATQESGQAEAWIHRPDGTTTTLAAASTLFPATATGLATDYHQHVVDVTGLAASTTYPYDIRVNGVDLNAEADSLTTAPARGTGTVSFVAFGDSGTGSAEQQQIASLLARDTFDFAVHGGDLAYGASNGTGAATHKSTDDFFFSIYRNWLRSRPMFPSMGNHDSRSANSDGRPYKDLFVLPEHAATSTYPDHAERYYSFDYGPIHVVVLDTELAFQDTARRDAQLAWMDADLAATTQPWKVAVFHRSPYSSGGEHGSDLAVRAAFGAVFDRHGVQLVISAHEHDYERTVPLTGGVATAGGTTYVVSGGGGAPLYPAGTAEWTAHSASVHHYLKGTANECVLQVSAIGLNAAAFDTVSLSRCDPASDTEAPAVSITAPGNGSTVSGNVSVTASATDNFGVASVTLLVDGVDVAQDTSSPFVFTWGSTTVANGTHTLTARAVDAAGNTTVSSPVSITVNNPVLGDGDILLYAADTTVVAGKWLKQDDAAAAGGKLIRNPDAGAAKQTTALAEPTDYFELTFTAQQNVPYRLWMRGKADGDLYFNDSAFVQFSGTTDFAIGTTSAAEYNLEDCSGCKISGWGWQDNGWGVGVLGPTITFTSPGPHTIRIQPREDGLSIDQIMLSPSAFLETAPGALKNDTTIYRRSSGEPAPQDTESPSVSITSPAAGATVSGVVTVTASASDNVGVARVEFFVGATLAGTATVAPFSFNWDTAAVANGSHSLTARALDAAGNAATSAAVAVTVENNPASDTTAPTVSITAPANGATVSGSVSVAVSAADDVEVTKVELLVDGIVAGTSSTAPFTMAWDSTAVGDGTHTLQARAYDAAMNIGTSAAVSVTVDNVADAPENVQPSVTITSPVDGASFAAPATITVAASASDSDGTIAKVEFYAGTALIGSTTSSPYEISWSDVAAGTYVLTAKATDNAGAVTTSAGVTITVSAPVGLPTPWASGDIGAVGLAGSATAENGTYTVKASGADIWGSADALHYVWQQVSGDVDIVARVASVEYVHAWTKAGVMIRETRTAGSAHALMLVSPAKGLAFQRRLSAGGLSSSTSGGSGTAPAWVKLERRGNTISAYRSADGASWTLVGSDTFTMAADVHVGLAVTSHDNTRLATGTFDAVSVVTPATQPKPGNALPSVSMTSPADGATFTAPASLTLSATASDSDGTIARVEFYAGTTLLGTATAAPYETGWTDVPAGRYTLTARATDDGGGVTTSSGVTISVVDPPPSAPWTSQDIGAVGLAGSATESNGTYTLKASGADVWDTADGLHYVSQRISGDVDIVARVSSVEYVHAWTKAGVMIRETLAADAPHGFMLVSPGKGLAFQRRLAAGGLSTNTSGGSGTAPAWVKLERRGNVLTAYRSADGVAWTLIGSDTFSMATEVYVGLALTSHDNSKLATATFDQVTITAR